MRIAFFLALGLLCSANLTAQQSRKLSRSESFWGLHFDRHSQLNDSAIGATLTEAMVDSMLRLARPDYIQVDAKGHPGVSSYPTRVGQRAHSYTKDPLRLIKRVTDKHNVALYVHYSGAIDQHYTTLHPQEARLGPNGMPDTKLISFFGNYSEKLLIPQLRELALEYKVDGAWIDGESWGIEPDYQPSALAEFKKETGIQTIPKAKDDPHYKTLLEFTRGKFLSYIHDYARAVHEVAPDFQICSNWAFSAMMPDPIPPDFGIDFLSGDFNPDKALSSANWYGRSLAGQGKSFDLMAWSFVHPNTPKTAIQLCQEASAVISLGGGCQIYFRQNADLSFQPSSFAIMKEVADFILPRRKFCKDVTLVPQVGLFLSTAGWKARVDEVYRPVGADDIRGVLDALLDGQHSVEVLKSHQLRSRMSEFPIIVISDWDTLETDIVRELKDYVFKGGKLLIVGGASTGYFADILGVIPSGSPIKISKPLGFKGRFANIEGTLHKITPLPGTNERAHLFSTTDTRYPAELIATTRQYGAGDVGAIYLDLGSTYTHNTSSLIRDLIGDMITTLAPDMLVKVKGSHKVHVSTTTKENRLLIQLINTSGDQANPSVQGVEEIPSLKNLQVSIATPRKPRSIVLQPENKPLPFNFDNGMTSVVLPELKIHSIIEVN